MTVKQELKTTAMANPATEFFAVEKEDGTTKIMSLKTLDYIINDLCQTHINVLHSAIKTENELVTFTY